MLRTTFIWLPLGLFLALFGIGFGLGCTDDFDKGMRRPSSNPVGMSDALIEETVDPSMQPADCPESQPKDGETCPTVMRAATSCRYAVRQCPGGAEVVHTMCCGRGSIWVPCGIQDPCPEGEGTVDAAAP